MSKGPGGNACKLDEGRAHDAGWTPWQQLSMGFTDSWAKEVAAQRSVVSLLPESFDIHAINVAESGTPRSYSLST